MKHVTRCRICSSDALIPFLDLGDQPLANKFLKDPTEVEKTYPLRLAFCGECNLVQLTDVVDKEVLFTDYIYFSSGVPRLSDHFKAYAKDMRRFQRPGDFVVELGSNDGVLLKFFQDAGNRVLGIDPAVNVSKVAEELGVPTRIDYFSEKLAVSLGEKANLVLANNTIAHVDDLHDLARGIKKLLAKDGVFVFEAPYLLDMIQNLTFDTSYHEHLSYLAVKPLVRLFQYYGLEIFDVHINPVQGKSLRVFVGHKNEHEKTVMVGMLLQLEKTNKMDQIATHRNMAIKIDAQKQKLNSIVRVLKKEGKSIAGYGAPAKGNTMLNFCKIGPDVIDWIVDDLPTKQWLFTPGMHIPVVDSTFAHQHEPNYYLMLAWNCSEQILEKEKDFISRGGKFILPIKGVKVL